MFIVFASLLAAGAAFADAGGAETRAVVLTVHGLDPSKLKCDPVSVKVPGAQLPMSEEDCNADPEACAQAASGSYLHLYACEKFQDAIKAKGFGAQEAEYRAGMFLHDRCKAHECRLIAFQWDGDITRSREYVEKLKAAITNAYEEAAGRPFLIIAHSWGGALAFEALAEMEEYGTARQKAVVVDKLSTIGTPVGGFLYSAAIRGLIGAQNFYTSPYKPASVKKWYNYWAWRDSISSRIDFADKNVRVDNASKYRQPTDLLSAAYRARGQDGLEADPQVEKDLSQVSPPESTELWHGAYYSDFSLSLESIKKEVAVTVYSDFADNYFVP